MKKYVLFFIILLLCFDINLDSKQWDTTPDNSPEKIKHLFKKIVVNKKNYDFSNEKLLKEIITGYWNAGEFGLIEIKRKGSYKRNYALYNSDNTLYEKIEIKGSWKISKNKLYLKPRRAGRWKEYVMDYYILKKQKPSIFDKKRNEYFFKIMFTSSTYNNTGLERLYMQFREINKNQ